MVLVWYGPWQEWVRVKHVVSLYGQLFLLLVGTPPVEQHFPAD